MPSKGNRKVVFRVDEDLEEEILRTIDRRNMWTRNREWDISEFVRCAIREKVEKMRRSRRRRPPASKSKPVVKEDSNNDRGGKSGISRRNADESGGGGNHESGASGVVPLNLDAP